MGFTDSSHLSKIFKKKYNMTIQNFKRDDVQVCAG
ncbi:hypothetical protein [Flavobacterium sp. 7A]